MNTRTDEERRTLVDQIIVGLSIALTTAIIGAVVTVHVLTVQMRAISRQINHQQHQITRIHQQVYRLEAMVTTKENDP